MSEEELEYWLLLAEIRKEDKEETPKESLHII